MTTAVWAQKRRFVACAKSCVHGVASTRRTAAAAACMETHPVNIVPDSAVSLMNSFVLSALVGNFPVESSRMARWPSTGHVSHTTHTSEGCVAEDARLTSVGYGRMKPTLQQLCDDQPPVSLRASRKAYHRSTHPCEAPAPASAVLSDTNGAHVHNVYNTGDKSYNTRQGRKYD